MNGGKLIALNGNQIGDHRVEDSISSAEVFINGQLIFGTNDFNKNLYYLEAPITLGADNTYQIELRSDPDSFIIINIVQDFAPPTVTINADPEAIKVNETATLIWSSILADSCTIEPNIGQVVANGSTTVSPAETTLYAITATGPGGQTQATFTISHVNSPPVAADDAVTTDMDVTKLIAFNSLTANDTDPDNDALTISGFTQPGHGTVVDSGNQTLTYTPRQGYFGGDSFVYTLSDGNGGTDIATVIVTVAETISDEIRLTPSDLAEDNHFGTSVAMSGDYAIVGAPHDDDGGSASGVVYVFKRDGLTFTEQAKLTASDASVYDYFGYSVAISGDYAAVGAYGHDDGGESSGAVYIFKREGDTWRAYAKLNAGDGASYDYFGWSVAMNGNYLFIGAYGDDEGGNESGAVYVFWFDGSSWTEQAKLTAVDAAAEDYFGWSVAIDSDSAIVGAYGKDDKGQESGAAYIFKFNSTTWSQQAKLTASNGKAYDFFGCSVDISGNHAIVGAYGVDDYGVDSGAAYIFSRSSPWAEQQKLTSGNWSPDGRLGSVVSIGPITSGLFIVGMGAPGYTTDGTQTGAVISNAGYEGNWATGYPILTASDAGPDDDFGGALSISDGSLIVGAPAKDDAGPDSGAAYVFPLSWVNMSANPQTIQKGEPSTLSWSSNNANTVTIDQGIGRVSPDGTWIVFPEETTTYTITAAGLPGVSSDSVTVNVIDPIAPPTVEISAIPSSVYPGDHVTLTWSSTHAYSCVIEPVIGNVEWNGSIKAYPTETTTYTITATGPAGSVTAKTTVTVSSFGPSNEVKITASDAASFDNFGQSVSISSDYAIVGAWSDDIGSYYDAGSACIFKRDGTAWTKQAKLIASDRATADYFGYSVSISGDYAIVGAWRNDDGGDSSGSAYIFKRDGTTWTQQAKLTASDAAAADYFGYSVSISGSYAIVGADGNDDGGDSSGSAYIFKRDGTTWTQQTKLTASDAAWDDHFAYSVSISGDYAIVGADGNGDGGSGSGSAYIFKRDGTSWTEQTKLTASDAAWDDHFGYSVSISGDYAIAGADRNDDGGSSSGSAYIFKRDGESWTEQTKLTASDAAAYSHFGYSVSISDDCAIIGANLHVPIRWGSAYVFKRDGTVWTEQAKLIANDATAFDGFGESVSISGNYAVVSANYADIGGYWDAGSAYIFILSSSVNITADPEILSIGQPSTLSWSSENAASVNINQSIGTVAASGSMVVSPQQTTTYTATATGFLGTSSDSVTIHVVDPTVPPTVSMSANPGIINAGETFTLSWSATNAVSCAIDPLIGTVGPGGTMVLSPTATTTYTITATGPVGTATTTVTVMVNNNSVPTVSLSANPEAIWLGETSTLTWNSLNATSCTIEPGIGKVDQNGWLPVSPATTTTYILTATGPGGTSTTQVTVTLNSVITPNILSPSNGETVYGSDIMVNGTVTNTEENETGLTVNGMVAMAYGDEFVVNHVPLTEGSNTITIIGTDTAGNSTESSIAVSAVPSDQYVLLTADEYEGVSPLETTFRIEATFEIADVSLSYSGPGMVETIDHPEPAEYVLRITGEGIYYFTAEVTDSSGYTYEDTIGVVVRDEASLDELLKAKWNGMKAALINGDIEGALHYHLERSKNRYRDAFTLLADDVPSLVSQMQEIELIYVHGRTAKYRINRIHVIEGESVTITYYIYFVKDHHGLWKIDQY